jgi:hypothetical protein
VGKHSQLDSIRRREFLVYVVWARRRDERSSREGYKTMGAATAAVNAIYHVGKVGSTYASFPYIVREEVTGSKVSVIASHMPRIRRYKGNSIVFLKMIFRDSPNVLASGQN